MVGEWDKSKVARFRVERFCPDCGRLLVSTPDEEVSYKTEPKRHLYFMYCPWCNKSLDRIDIYEPYLSKKNKPDKINLEFGGTICPECGHNNEHIHHGWLSLNLESIKTKRGVLATTVKCEECGTKTFMLRTYGRDFTKEETYLINQLMADIRDLD